MACDNFSAISTAAPDYIPRVSQANFDLVQAIVSLIKVSPLTWLWQHVKGHQDDHILLRPLTLLERLNIHMDSLAKGYWSHIIRHSPIMPTPPMVPIWGEGWQVWHGTTKIVTPHTDTLYDAILDGPTQYWWVRHNRFPEAALPLIDWDACHRAHKSLPITR